MSDPNSINALKEEVHSRTNGRLDILVNNAGRNYTVPGLEVELEEIKITFEANLFGVMLMCQAFAPMLIEAKGTIVQIGSLAGKGSLILLSPSLKEDERGAEKEKGGKKKK